MEKVEVSDRFIAAAEIESNTPITVGTTTRLRLISDGTREGTWVETEDGKRVEGLQEVSFSIGIDDLDTETTLTFCNLNTTVNVKSEFYCDPVWDLGSPKPLAWRSEVTKDLHLVNNKGSLADLWNYCYQWCNENVDKVQDSHKGTFIQGYWTGEGT